MSRASRSISMRVANPVAEAVAKALRAPASAGSRRRASLLSLGALLLPAMAGAQNAPAPEDDAVDVVIVSARREALQNATERKKNADSIVDSVVADDAGILPDNSITEDQQRVSGESNSRFMDADHL